MTDENDSTNQMMNDPDNDPKLTAYAMGELSTDEARAVERLIASSPKLATAVDEIRATIESLESALSQEAPLDLVLSGQQRSAIAAAAQTGGLQIDQEATSVIRAAEETPATRSLRWGRWFLAAAIATVLIGGGIFLANPDVQFARQTARNEVSSDKPAGAKTAPEGMEVFADRFEPDLGGQRNEIASDESASARVDEENLDLAVAASQLAVAKTDGPLSVARRESSSQVRSLRSKLSSIDSPREGIERFGRLQGAEAMQEFQQEMDDVQSKDDLIAAIGGRGGAGMGGGMLPPPAAASPQRFAPMRRSLDGNELLSRESFGEQSPRASSKASVGDRPARRLSRSRDAGKNVMEKRKTNLIQSRQQRQAQAAKPNSKVKPQVALKKKASKSWKSVKAIPNTTRLMVGDKEELDLTGMQVNVQVDGFRARVLIDYLYYNDRDQPLEGDFKIRLPVDSSLYYFAFGESANELTPQQQLATREFVDNGARTVSFTPAAITKSRNDLWRNVKEARMVPREQAAHAFRETVRRRVDPALVQWSGAGVFSAKVFPLAAKKVHRIVIGYDVNLTRSGGRLLYQLDLPKSTGDCRIEINARDVDGVQYKIQPEVEPVEVDHNDELHQRFTFDQRPAGGVRLTATAEIPLLLKSNELADEFWATQLAPELPAQQTAGSSRGVFMLDTSLSSSPDKFNVWLKLLEATLAKNRDTMKEFAVLTFSVDGRFWKPQYVANTDGNLDELKATLGNLVLEGATDLYAAMEKVTTTEWVTDGEAPDFFLLSDGAANWGETNGRLIGSLFADQKTGSLFAYQTGMTGTAIANLRFLTGQTGGAVFSVTSEDEIAAAATAHRKRPWRLLGISAEGATDVMTAGRAKC